MAGFAESRIFSIFQKNFEEIKTIGTSVIITMSLLYSHLFFKYYEGNMYYFVLVWGEKKIEMSLSVSCATKCEPIYQIQCSQRKKKAPRAGGKVENFVEIIIKINKISITVLFWIIWNWSSIKCKPNRVRRQLHKPKVYFPSCVCILPTCGFTPDERSISYDPKRQCWVYFLNFFSDLKLFYFIFTKFNTYVIKTNNHHQRNIYCYLCNTFPSSFFLKLLLNLGYVVSSYCP